MHGRIAGVSGGGVDVHMHVHVYTSFCTVAAADPTTARTAATPLPACMRDEIETMELHACTLHLQ